MLLPKSHPPLFNLGFRPFFAGACVFAALAIAYWLAIYFGITQLPAGAPPPALWHAHEMLYGYSLAVVAGFLLTAVKNWTGQQTPHGLPLAALFIAWMCARLVWLLDASLVTLAAVFDLGFILALVCALALPVIVTRQWRQLAILSKLVLLGVGNACYYLGTLGYFEGGVQIAIYGALYLLIALILTIGRRVIPFFVERGVGYQVTLYNSRWIDTASLAFFLAFFISELFLKTPWLTQLTAAAMFLITTVRIVGWYTPGIKTTPLLWSLFIALGFIDLGFLLIATQQWTLASPYLPMHAFGVGGIGIMTMGMMARVAIGHTGRDLAAPPRALLWCLGSMLLGAMVRVILPAVLEQHYRLWVGISGTCWIIAFTLFASAFLPILSQPRTDHRYG